MSDAKTGQGSTREERLAAQLRANLRRRKAAARKSVSKQAQDGPLDAGPKKDAPQP